MNEQIYEITAENWNPSGIEHVTESDIRATAETFGLNPDLITIDPLGNVLYDGEKIGYAE